MYAGSSSSPSPHLLVSAAGALLHVAALIIRQEPAWRGQALRLTGCALGLSEQATRTAAGRRGATRAARIEGAGGGGVGMI
jgi:hypothetical protein